MPHFSLISGLFPYYSLIIFLSFHLYFPITISQWCPCYFPIISKLQKKTIISFVCLYAPMIFLLFPYYFRMVSLCSQLFPYYFHIVSLLLLNCFPIMSLLFHSYVPIMFLLLPLFPKYFPIISLLCLHGFPIFPYCFPFSSQSFLYYCPNYFFLFPCYIPIIILLFNSFCFGLRIYLFFRFYYILVNLLILPTMHYVSPLYEYANWPHQTIIFMTVHVRNGNNYMDLTCKKNVETSQNQCKSHRRSHNC